MKLGWLLVLASQLLVVAGFWAWNHVHHPLGNQLTGEAAGLLLAYGRLAGLLAALAILVQLLLVGRVPWLGRAYGFDRLARAHHLLGFSLVVLLVAHPVLVTLGHAAEGDVSWLAQGADFFRHWPGLWAADLGLGVMAVAIGFSLLMVLNRLRYELWYAVHLTLYVALALVFFHQVAAGSDFADHPWCRWYWYALNGVVAANLLGYRLFRPWWRFRRHRFAVSRLVPETADVTSVCLEGRDLAGFAARGGQFVIVRFLARGFRWEEHPFSLSARPDGRQLRLTIKAAGDFTRRIPQLLPGTPVVVDGPHGIFTADRCRAGKVLLLAGGIGITPIRAIAEELLEQGRDLVLLYANRNRAGIVFERELEALAAAAAGRLKIHHVLSGAEPGWTGEQGHLDQARVLRLVPDVREREVFLCGPPPMMRSLRQALAALGVPRGRLHDERFAL
ncbi:MAG: ferredoxin reductase family protein [Lentisphaeria bacterium]